MKVLFLDLDGVVNSHDWFRRRVMEQPIGNYFERQIDPQAIVLLNEIIEATGVKVVISSTWRKNYTLQELRAGLSSRGFSGEIIGVTGEDLSAIRGREIQKWLDDNKDYGIERFVIVDDDSDFLASQLPFFVKTSFDRGLLDEHVLRVIRILVP
jgi:hypothetical protein